MVLIFSLMAIIIAILMYIQYKRKLKETWNYGYCPDCYTKWEQFDYDPITGHKGFVCPKCGKIIWLDIDLRGHF